VACPILHNINIPCHFLERTRLVRVCMSLLRNLYHRTSLVPSYTSLAGDSYHRTSLVVISQPCRSRIADVTMPLTLTFACTTPRRQCVTECSKCNGYALHAYLYAHTCTYMYVYETLFITGPHQWYLRTSSILRRVRIFLSSFLCPRMLCIDCSVALCVTLSVPLPSVLPPRSIS